MPGAKGPDGFPLPKITRATIFIKDGGQFDYEVGRTGIKKIDYNQLYVAVLYQDNTVHIHPLVNIEQMICQWSEDPTGYGY